MKPEVSTFGTAPLGLQSDPETVQAAVARLTRDSRTRELLCIERRTESRLPFHRPVEVNGVVEHRGRLATCAAHPVEAYTRDISSRGVGLLHDEPIEHGLVLLRFEMLDADSVLLVAYLRWCCYVGDFWYLSGGPLVGAAESSDGIDKMAGG